MSEPFIPMKAIIGGLLEPSVPPSEESLLWKQVLIVLAKHSQAGTIEDGLEELEKMYEIKIK
jgi:hypothetical protein